MGRGWRGEIQLWFDNGSRLERGGKDGNSVSVKGSELGGLLKCMCSIID